MVRLGIQAGSEAQALRRLRAAARAARLLLSSEFTVGLSEPSDIIRRARSLITGSVAGMVSTVFISGRGRGGPGQVINQ
jgi:hypothetical protein